MNEQKIYNELNLQALDKVFTEAIEDLKDIYSNIRINRDRLLQEVSKILLDYNIQDEYLKLSDTEKKLLVTKLFELLEGFTTQEFELEETRISESLTYTTIETNQTKNYIVSLGTKNPNFKKLRNKRIDEIVNHKVNGELWSDRLWDNKKDMELQMKKCLRDFFNGKISVNTIKKEINDKYSISAYNTDRLVVTEVARVQCEVNEDFFKNEEIKEVIYLATLDKKTCKHCGGYDGKRFDISDSNRPKLPLHPKCRCCYIEVLRDWKPKTRKDNSETNTVIDWVDYEEWKLNPSRK